MAAIVQGPKLGSPEFGLLVSAPQIPEADERWTGGFTFEVDPCGDVQSGAWGCAGAGSDSGEKTIGAAAISPSYIPFTVWAGDACSTLGGQSRDFQGRARRKLIASRSKQIEAELWTGAMATSFSWPNASLASSATEISGSEVASADALACLEQALGQCSGEQRGMIHASIQQVSRWTAERVVRREGALLVTQLGTIVVPGAGYDGSGTDGSIPGSGQWVYASQLVQIRLSEIVVVPENLAQGVRRSDNTVEVRAEQMAAATFDPCCVFAILSDLDPCPALVS